ncbi:MAG: DUF4870 family protein [Burkholderiaceae bacterium]
MEPPVLSEDSRIEEGRKLATVCYALYAVSCLIGVAAVAAIIIDYLKRDDFAGTWVASHFEWQIKTFWYALAGAIVGWLLTIILIGFLILLGVWVWVIYRVVKGWLALYERKPVDATKLL